MNYTKNNIHQSGNVLFYILIAVGLLAALSFTVAGSLRSGGKSASQQRLQSDAASVIDFGNILAAASAQLLLRGVDFAALSFENSFVAGYENQNCKDGSCKVFDINGGGVNYKPALKEWLDPAAKDLPHFGEMYITASAEVGYAGRSGADLLVIIPYLKKDLCADINSKLGIKDVPKLANGPAELDKPFQGMIDDNPSGVIILGDNSNGPVLSGCVESSGGGNLPAAGTYHFYRVLIPR